MRYSTDLRKRVLDFIKAGGSKAEASRRFSITRVTIDRWLKAKDPFAYHKPGPRGPRSIDYDALKQQVAAFPDQTLKERADYFGVSAFCIQYSLKRIGYTCKKKVSAIKSAVMTNDKHIVNNSQK